MSNIQLHLSRASEVKGFSLMELMIVLGIAAIMMAAGAPTMTRMLNSNVQTSVINELIAGVSSARSYALIHKRPVVLEPMDDTEGNDDWGVGFFIKPGTIADESIYETAFQPDTKITITSDAPLGFLSFDRLGRVTPANSTFTVCNSGTNLAVEIDVGIFGRAVVKKTPEGAFDYQPC